MRHWFHRNFEDPSNETPRDEGEFVYIWGGPYDAHEELYDEFGTLVPEERIQELADEIVGEDGIYDWAPGTDHSNTKLREEEWRNEQEAEEDVSEPTETLDQIVSRLQSGVKPSYGDAFEQSQRKAVIGALDALEAALASIKPAHGGIGHNKPPPDDDSPQASALEDIREAKQAIAQELAKESPDALEVAKATSRLRTALGWLWKKLDKGLDAIIGAAAVGAAYHAKDLLPPIIKASADVVSHVTQWLSHVTLPF